MLPMGIRIIVPAVMLVLATGDVSDASGQQPASSHIDVRWGAGCNIEHKCTLAAGDTAEVLYLTSVMNVMSALDAQFTRMPAGLKVELERCTVESAYYTSETRTITMCVELYSRLFLEIRRAFVNIPEYNRPEFTFQAASWAAEFVFLHELSHAIIDLWDVPITGNEEDAADQFATWFTIRSNDMRRLPLASIAYRGLAIPGLVTEALGETRPYGAVHPNMHERELNIACWSEGAVGSGLRSERLPASRRAGCVEEWGRINRSWVTLLRAFLKPH
jgi:hypothetical protein